MNSGGGHVARKSNSFGAMLVIIFAAAAVAFALPASSQGTAANPAQTARRIPAFHSAPPAKPLGATLDPKQFNDVSTQNAYAMAAKVKNVLYQEPCFCGCDANDGHRSLYDCFATDHGASCDTCRMEAIFTYEQTRKARTPAQIRKAIINDEWKKVDLTQYATLKDVR
jgi:hypothetical protein